MPKILKPPTRPKMGGGGERDQTEDSVAPSYVREGVTGGYRVRNPCFL